MPRSRITTWSVKLSTLVAHHKEMKSLVAHYPNLMTVVIHIDEQRSFSNSKYQYLFPEKIKVVCLNSRESIHELIRSNISSCGWSCLYVNEWSYEGAIPYSCENQPFVNAARYAMPPTTLAECRTKAFCPELVQDADSVALTRAVLEATNIQFPDIFRVALLNRMRDLVLSDAREVNLAMQLYRRYFSVYQESTTDCVVRTKDDQTVNTHLLPFLFHTPYFRKTLQVPFEISLPFSVEAVGLFIELMQDQNQKDLSPYNLQAICELLPHLSTYQLPKKFQERLMHELGRRLLAAEEDKKLSLWTEIKNSTTRPEQLFILSTFDFSALKLEKPQLDGCGFAIDGEHLLQLQAASNFTTTTLLEYTDTVVLSHFTLATAVSRALTLGSVALGQITTLVIDGDIPDRKHQLVEEFVSHFQNLEHILYIKTASSHSVSRFANLVPAKAQTYVQLVARSDRYTTVKDCEQNGWKIVNPVDFFVPKEEVKDPEDLRFKSTFELKKGPDSYLKLFYPPGQWTLKTSIEDNSLRVHIERSAAGV